MSNKFIYFMLSCALTLGIQSFADEKKEQQPDVGKISEALGHLIGKNLVDMGIKLDIAQVIKGLKDSSNGKTSPLSESDCVKAISSAQENAFKEKAKNNLKEAEAFLQAKGKEAGVISLEEGKLQYKIEKEGMGESVAAHGSPVVLYTGKFLNGVIFGSSEKAETVSLDEMIPGLKKGLIGMKEGEKRTFFVHPDLGYGTAGMLPPNSLLTFEVEIVKAETPTPAVVTQQEEKEKGDIR